MTVGFFTVFRRDPQHYLHAMALVREAHAVMPDVPVVQLTDHKSPLVHGVDRAQRLDHGPMLQRRLEHYAVCDGEWVLVDTDVSIRQDVRAVFDDPAFDVALTDRQWPHVPQPADVLHTMPFNTGVVFSRSSAFWDQVLTAWRGLNTPQDWFSEQRAVYEVVRSGRFRVKILPGMTFNYPPKSMDDPADGAALVHHKGPRKAWRTQQIYQEAARCA